MKNYVAKLRENEEKGFSLVELIIVMAIMAILVGVVASQVIPYMEKSRQSKDQQQISSLAVRQILLLKLLQPLKAHLLNSVVRQIQTRL